MCTSYESASKTCKSKVVLKITFKFYFCFKMAETIVSSKEFVTIYTESFNLNVSE